MNRNMIERIRESADEYRAEAMEVLANETVSKADLRWFLEHDCNRCEIGICDYSYESMIEDAELQVDGMHKDVTQALDIALDIAELSGRFPEWAERDLRRSGEDFLKSQWSEMKSFMIRLDEEYDFWLDLNDPSWAEEFESFHEFDMAV